MTRDIMGSLRSKMKPCPFCGGEAYVNYSDRGEIFGVRCKKWGGDAGSIACMGAGAYAHTEEQAIANWNRRALSGKGPAPSGDELVKIGQLAIAWRSARKKVNDWQDEQTRAKPNRVSLASMSPHWPDFKDAEASFNSALAAPVPAPSGSAASPRYEAENDARDWAVERWKAEVANRPLQNVHRASLDRTWRQVIRHFGGDPDLLCGPDHYALIDAALSDKGPAPSITCDLDTSDQTPCTPNDPCEICPRTAP